MLLMGSDGHINEKIRGRWGGVCVPILSAIRDLKRIGPQSTRGLRTKCHPLNRSGLLVCCVRGRQLYLYRPPQRQVHLT